MHATFTPCRIAVRPTNNVSIVVCVPFVVDSAEALKEVVLGRHLRAISRTQAGTLP